MEVILTKNAGFCFGVQRVTEMLEEELSELNKKININILGELIHNPLYTDYLTKKGIKTVGSVEELDNKVEKVVIRAHGIPKNIEVKLHNKGVEIIDGTCPFVKRVQILAEELSSKGYKIFLLGEESHPEVEGILSYASDITAIKSASNLPSLEKGTKIAFISQTTQSIALFEEISSILKNNYKEPLIKNTICNSTNTKQKEALELSKKVDLMIVIGGKNSSNTTRLKEVCEKYTKTYHIDSAGELVKNWFVGADRVGVTAGASTPDFSINDVMSRVKELD